MRQTSDAFFEAPNSSFHEIFILDDYLTPLYDRRTKFTFDILENSRYGFNIKMP